VKLFRFILLVSLLTKVVVSPLHPQAEQTDTVKMGLRGPVKTLQVSRAVYEDRNGQWVRKKSALQSVVEFNETGCKTEEWFYGGYSRRNTYAYGDTGRMVAFEEYRSGRLVSSWEMSFGADGSSYSQFNYKDDGSISSKILRRFDTAGDKLSDIHYDDKGITVQRWERDRTTTGTVITYSPRWGEDESTRFDSWGRMTEMRKGWGDNLQKWTYTYDAAGLLTEASYTDKAVSPDVYTFRYDSAGNLVEVLHKQTSGVPVAKRRYTYSSTGSPATETVDWFDGEGTLDHTWIYSYDIAGNIVSKEYRHARRHFTCRWAYHYDGSGLITRETFYDSDDRVFTMVETTYDGRGNKISESSSGRGIAQGFRVIYEYDAASRLLETVRYDLEGRLQSRESSRYNEKGDLTESARYNPDGSLTSSTKYQYVYDQGGNWIERTTLVTDNAKETYNVHTEIVSRILSYYP